MTIQHISYSQYKSYTSCPRNWYLSKIRQAEEKQTWYLPIGTAVHWAIERDLRPDYSNDTTLEEYFYSLISRQMEVEPDLSKWLAGGPSDSPIKEERALERAQQCYEKALTFLSDLDVWEVELDASGILPGLDVPIKAFIDIVGEHKKKGPTILDWKTGSTKPDNFQLETYAALLQQFDKHELGGLTWHGKYAMLAPGASNARFVDLSYVDPAEVGAKYQAVCEKMVAKLYPTNAGFSCKFCFNQDNCLLEAGPTARAKYYDRAHRDGLPY